MFEVIWNSIADNVFEIIGSVLSIIVAYYIIPTIKNDLIPWLKDKRIYSLIQCLVQAAEKMAEGGMIPKIDKKATVIKWLKEQGIEITSEIDAFIESAVKELDMITGVVVGEILETAVEIETEDVK